MRDSTHEPVDPTLTEAVFLRDGKEFDWIDPVYSVQEDELAWFIEGSMSVYRVEKGPGVTIELRRVEER